MEKNNRNKKAENEIIKLQIANLTNTFATYLYTLSVNKSTTKKELLDSLSTYILSLLDHLVFNYNYKEKTRMKINDIIYKLVEIKGLASNNSSSVNNNTKKAILLQNIKDYSNELMEESLMLQGVSKNSYSKYIPQNMISK